MRDLYSRELALLIIFASMIFAYAANAEKSGGTVNIVLANKNGLVAVTDSMISYSNGAHLPVGNKLYQLDNHTVCAMAGLYTHSGPDIDSPTPNELLDNFFVRVPSLMNYYKARITSKGYSFADKYSILIETFAFDLTTNIQALEADHPLPSLQGLGLELTIAGYDEDGQLKLASVDLMPQRTRSGIEYSWESRRALRTNPACQLGGLRVSNNSQSFVAFSSPPIRVIAAGLTCEIAGVTDIATAILAHPESYVGFPAVQVYAAKTATGIELTVKEMRDLALTLEEQTTLDEQLTKRQLVGGDPEVAILSQGVLIESPSENQASPLIGEALHQPHILNNQSTCDPRVTVPYNSLFSLGPGSQQQVNLTDCRVLLDGILFHDSSFTAGVLEYDGTVALLFPTSNKVYDSILQLGYGASLDEPSVKRLICSFPWKLVIRNQREQSFLHPSAPDWAVVTPGCRTAWNVEHGFGLHY